MPPRGANEYESDYDLLLGRACKAERRVKALERMLACRAGKLLYKDKAFVVVACDEEYYVEVYSMIRQSEKATGRWTDEDEGRFVAALAAKCGEAKPA